MNLSKKRARIGLYSVGLKAYWSQFPGLRDRLIDYGKFIESRLSEYCEVKNFGMVDDETSGRAAGEWFAAENVELVFLHSATYCTSASVLPVHQVCRAPVVILNLQPAAAMNYEATGTGEWLANCGACPVPEYVNALGRCGISAEVVNGILGMYKSSVMSAADENTAGRAESNAAWTEIIDTVRVAEVKRNLCGARFGFLGNYYAGMLDMYSDFTLLQKSFGIHIEPLEMDTLEKSFDAVSDGETKQMRRRISEFFRSDGGASTDFLAGKPDEESLDRAAKTACALGKMVEEYRLDALSYYYHGEQGSRYQELAASMIVGNSLLTADGVPCAGEGDIKTNIAMKICDLLGAGGSFTEIVAADYDKGTVILGHDGPFHIKIAADRPVLRGMSLYHGKKGAGVSVEAKVRPGPITLLAVTQTPSGEAKMIVMEGRAVEGDTLRIGNTQTQIDFSMPVDSFYSLWFGEGPTHHCAMSVGHNAGIFKKIANSLGIECAVLNAKS